MSILYPFVPNWSAPVEMTYEFKTDIIKSRNGYEQRAAMRSLPRITLAFESLPFTGPEIDGQAANFIPQVGNNKLSTELGVLPPTSTHTAIDDPGIKPGTILADDVRNLMFNEWTMLTSGGTSRYFYGPEPMGFQHGFFIGGSGSGHYVYRDFRLEGLGIPAEVVDRGTLQVIFEADAFGVGSSNSGGGNINANLKFLPDAGLGYDPVHWDPTPYGSTYIINDIFGDYNTGGFHHFIMNPPLVPVGTRYIRVSLKVTETFPIYANNGVANMKMTAIWPQDTVVLNTPRPERGGLLTQTPWWQLHGQEEMHVPEYSRSIRIITSPAQGDTSFDIDRAAPVWLVAGATICLRFGRTIAEYTVGSIAGVTITLASPLAEAWRYGSFIHPIHVGRAAPSTTGTALTSVVGTNKGTFKADPGLSPAYDSTATPEALGGAEIWLKKPDFKAAINFTWENEIETIDFDVGVEEHHVPLIRNGVLSKLSYLGKTAEEVDEILGLFYRMKGQRGVFYVPSWTDDISRTTPMPTGLFNLIVRGLDIYNLFSDSITHRAVTVFYRDGTHQVNRVGIVSSAGPNTNILFNDPWTQEVSEANAKMICWTNLYRMASDTVTVSWVTSETATISYSIRMMEDNLT